eukprot:jgi/Galph1/1598/GphlegSOOS_G285.1
MVDCKDVFKQESAEIDEKFVNQWLTNVPCLREECEVTTLSSVVGEEIEVAGKTFQVSKTETFEEIADLLSPITFPREFPLQLTSSGVSRILLRQEFIERWNAQICSLGKSETSQYPKRIVLSGASRLGKSTDLYVAAVLARYCKIPVQYFANTSAIVKHPQNDSFVARRYLKMLLFMNANVLDDIKDCLISSSPKYEFLIGVPLKKVIYFALENADIDLCMEIRDIIMNLSPRNLLISDNHNVFWKELSNDISLWPTFSSFTNNCGLLIAGSEHYGDGGPLPCTFDSYRDYLEPLNNEEYNLRIELQDYPSILRHHSPQVVEPTVMAPGMIAIMVLLYSEPVSSFEELEKYFACNIQPFMERKHVQYIESLKTGDVDDDFLEILRALFLGDCTPSMDICNSAYLARGLFIVMKNRTLRFYNNIAGDILFFTFKCRMLSEERLLELSPRPCPEKKEMMHLKNSFFRGVFPDGQFLSHNAFLNAVGFEGRKWLRLDGKYFGPICSGITSSCWLRFTKDYAPLDLAYVDIEDDNWMLLLLQLSIYSFPQHNRVQLT